MKECFHQGDRSWRIRLANAAILLAIVTTSCGYSLRNSRTPSRLSASGVRRIYVPPVRNETFQVGVENTVYNAVVRALGAMAGARAVASRDDADAELQVRVVAANRAVSGQTNASDLSPKGLGSNRILVATEYRADIGCQFDLRRIPKEPQAVGELIWSSGFSRSKPFPGNNQVWSLGSTSALINASELNRAFADAAMLMGRDLVQALQE